MTDIPSREIIEEAQRTYAANLEHGNFAAMEMAITAALSRLTVSPLPGKIAGLLLTLEIYISTTENCIDAQSGDNFDAEEPSEALTKIAAALQRLAGEVERLETKQTTASDVIRHYKERAHGAERELGIVRARIAELEADVEARIAAMAEMNAKLVNGADAIKAKTIEECAQLLDGRAQKFNKLRDPGMANHCRSLAKAIRAINQPEAGGGE